MHKHPLLSLSHRFFGLAIALAFVSAPLFSGYYVTLNDNEINPGKGKNLINMYVTNESDAMKAIMLSPKLRNVDSSGVETVSETEDLVVFPAQLILPPRSEKAVSIRWLGEQNISRERSYRVIVDELNVGKKQAKDSKIIRTKVRYVKSVYVAPYKTVNSLMLEDAGRDVLEDGTPVLRLKLYNNGTVRELLQNIILEYKSMDRIASLSITASEMEPFKSNRNILANNRLEFWIPWPESIDTKVDKFYLLDYNLEDEAAE
jgi:P pilus assembly chaperone PapD|tara:strand:- start:3606 stop:4385 length:780 start_codon:yes stop_codon:yes gene_type:complete